MSKQVYHVCYNCKIRHIGCHAKCELYQNEVNESNKLKEENKLKNTWAKPEFTCKTKKGAKYLKSQLHRK